MSQHLAAGLAVAMVGGPLVLLVECRSYVRAREDMDGVGQTIRFLERWQLPLLLAAAVLWFNGRETAGRRLEEIQKVPAPQANLSEQSSA